MLRRTNYSYLIPSQWIRASCPPIPFQWIRVLCPHMNNIQALESWDILCRVRQRHYMLYRSIGYIYIYMYIYIYDSWRRWYYTWTRPPFGCFQVSFVSILKQMVLVFWSKGMVPVSKDEYIKALWIWLSGTYPLLRWWQRVSDAEAGHQTSHGCSRLSAWRWY